MPTPVVVSAPPPGAGLNFSTREDAGATSTTSVLARGGAGVDMSQGASNAGANGAIAVVSSGAYVNKIISARQQRVAQYEGSIILFGAVPLVVAQPSAAFTWPFGRHELHAVAHWDVAPGANIDSGISLLPVAHNRVTAGSFMNDGILLGNHAGVLQLITRGNGRYEEIPLPFAGPLNEWNKIGLVIRFATSTQPASVTAMVNDRVAAVRQWAGAHALPLVPGGGTGSLFWHFVHAEAVTYLNLLNWEVGFGPDTSSSVVL